MRTAAIILALGLLAQVSCDDYESAVATEEHYCEMTEAGYWPAYKPEIKCEK